MNACRANPKAAAAKPISSTATPSSAGVGAKASPRHPTSATAAAISIAARSPARDTTQLAGRLPSTWPTTAAEAITPASARFAPMSTAMTATSGRIAYSPSEKSTDGP